jgi:hypothetical protein
MIYKWRKGRETIRKVTEKEWNNLVKEKYEVGKLRKNECNIFVERK